MRYLALLLAAACALPAYALTKVDIYSTEVVVDSEQPNADELARQQGMLDVLVKASGDSSAATNPVVKKALGKSSQYITQLGYTQVDGQQAMRLTFNSQQINTLLTQADLSSWPVERKNVMVWLVEDNGYDRSIVWEHTNSANANQLKKEANRRGLPLTFPIGDFDDITGVQTTDLWGGFVEPIAQASLRYPVDAVAVIRLQGNSLRYTLYDQTPDKLGKNTLAPITGSASGELAVATAIDEISDYYAAQNASTVLGESAGMVTVSFSRISNADAFFTLERALGRLASTAKVDVAEINGDEVTVRVSLLGSLESFEEEVLRLGLVKKSEQIEMEDNQVVVPETEVTETTDGSLPQDNAVDASGEVSTETPVSESVQAPSVDVAQPVGPALRFEWLY
ncbi:DUF2066 domain-containing protein [Vibrio maritimus]|uniref:DUF2066 domain-containing protein n=1 Tax=Vibrio maritimus TaxID=990268 RepID=UPI001F42F927|nr:DUF2066 domain-containing protein [Vibrio maritimus]